MARQKVRESQPEETEEQMARLGLLVELLEQRGEGYYKGEEGDQEINHIIEFFMC